MGFLVKLYERRVVTGASSWKLGQEIGLEIDIGDGL